MRLAPPGPLAGTAALVSGISTTIASDVRKRPAIECRAGHLGRVDDTGHDQALEDAGGSVVGEVLILGLEGLGYDNSSFFARIGHDLAPRLFKGAAHNLRRSPRRLRAS
jgi:hypothetical protein